VRGAVSPDRFLALVAVMKAARSTLRHYEKAMWKSTHQGELYRALASLDALSEEEGAGLTPSSGAHVRPGDAEAAPEGNDGGTDSSSESVEPA
jgi:hypothetical protein